jgi:hypothetical protein
LTTFQVAQDSLEKGRRTGASRRATEREAGILNWKIYKIIEERTNRGRRGARTVNDAVEIHVGIAERATSERVAADADRRDGADLVEELEDDTLSDVAKGSQSEEEGEGTGQARGRGKATGHGNSRSMGRSAPVELADVKRGRGVGLGRGGSASGGRDGGRRGRSGGSGGSHRLAIGF